jgi:hypothetical protein
MGCTRRPRVGKRILWRKFEETGCGLRRPLLPASPWS